MTVFKLLPKAAAAILAMPGVESLERCPDGWCCHLAFGWTTEALSGGGTIIDSNLATIRSYVRGAYRLPPVPAPAAKLPFIAVASEGEPWGTSLQGYVKTTFAALVATMGKPHECNGDKVTVQWCWTLESGESFTVYDWKQCSTPKGEYQWHIGGHSETALAAFQRFTGLCPASMTEFAWKA